MRRSLVMLGWFVACCAARAQVSVVDDSGATLRLAQPARRIVTLAPHLAETVFAAGAGDKLVGTVEFSDFPETVKKLPKVGGYSRLDLEAIAALKPDLIIGWASGNAPAHIDKLRALSFPVYISQPNQIGDVADEIERLLHKGGEVGKRLDFLIQELHREANTLGSKSAALDLTHLGVDMKVLIEQMREQVQNIE